MVYLTLHIVKINIFFILKIHASIKYLDVVLKAAIIWAPTRENLSSVVCEQQRRRQACASAQSSIISRLAASEI